MRDNDGGIGLIEVVISMFLIALVAIAFLPLLIRNYDITRENTDLATATQLLSAEFEKVRDESPTCTALTAFESAPTVAVVDDRGVSYQAHRDITCPSAYPGTARFDVSIQDDAATRVVTGSTLVYVEGP